MAAAFAGSLLLKKKCHTTPEGVPIPVECLPDSDVPAIRSTVSHPANNRLGQMRRSPRMPAVRFCCPAFVGAELNDQVVPLPSLLSENLASRVSIRTLANVIFLEIGWFPFQQRLKLNRAFEDTTLPARFVTDQTNHGELLQRMIWMKIIFSN